MNIEVEFNKSLRLLDIGNIDKAIGILKAIASLSQRERNGLFYLKANCVLGEFFFEKQQYDEAKYYLTEVANTKISNEMRDVVDYEKETAQGLLSKIEK